MDTANDLRQLLSHSLAETGQTLLAYLPNFLTALLLVLMGWLLARLTKNLICRFGHAIDHISNWLHTQAVPNAPTVRRTISQPLSRIGYWLVLVLFIAAAARALGLPGMAEWSSRFLNYLPNLFAAATIMLIGFLLSGLAFNLILKLTEQSLDSARTLGRSVQVLIIALSITLGLSQLALDISLLVNLITLAVAALLGAFGLAFGLGAQHQVSNIIAEQNLRHHYQTGQLISIDGVQGEIIMFTGKAVILKTAKGTAMVPAKRFNEQVSELILVEDSDD